METITWLTTGDGFSDYRPVYSPDGSAVLFERTAAGAAITQLYLLKLDGSEPEPFLQDAPEGMSQTRPDWIAGCDDVAFCEGNTGPIWLASSDGTGAHALPGTEGMIYPCWFADGQSLAVMTNLKAPYTVRISRKGKLIGRLTPDDLYAGMPSVSRQGSPLLAFPGQPASPPYRQDSNKIYIATDPSTAHLLDGQQGRAPWWTPDGSMLAFESDRATESEYAIYLSTPDGTQQVQLTDSRFNAQHAKFSPDGTTIVLAAQPNGAGPGQPWAIGTIPVGTMNEEDER